MANKFYAPGDERADKVRDLFATIAPRYDLINDLQSFGLHRYWKKYVVRMAAVKPGTRALDVCCGTGDLAFAMARAGAAVSGLDFSGSMLEMARRRSPESKIQSPRPEGQRSTEGQRSRTGATSVSFVRGDALEIPFQDSQFDVVTVGYGLRNLADYRTGLREMCRVARPGGRLLVLDFGKPDHALWRSFYFTYLRWCVPCFGRHFCGDAQAYAYILESLKHYPAQRGVAAAMTELNCQRVEVVKFLGGVMTINYGEKS